MMEYFMVILLAVMLCAFYIVMRKVINVHKMQYNILDQIRNIEENGLMNLFGQIEAYLNINKELNLSGTLPPTRGWAASPDFLQLLVSYSRENKPKVVLECSSGVSTLVLARCAQLNALGHVYSLEHDKQFADVTRKHLDRLGLSQWATVMDAPLVSVELGGNKYFWYDISSCYVSDIEMFVIDGPPQSSCPLARYPAGPLIFKNLRDGAVVFLDDAGRPDEQNAVCKWEAEGLVEVVRPAPVTEKGCALLKKRSHNISSENFHPST